MACEAGRLGEIYFRSNVVRRDYWISHQVEDVSLLRLSDT